MFDVKWIRDNPEAFDRGRARRNLAPLSAEILALDSKRRAAQTSWQEMQARRNDLSKQIGQLKAKKEDASAVMAEVAGLKDTMADAEKVEQDAAKALDDLLASIPNLPADDVPDGHDEKANREVRVVGGKPNFAFAPKQHFELGEGLGLMDFERCREALRRALRRARRACSRGWSARWRSSCSTCTPASIGYTEVSPPLLVRDDGALRHRPAAEIRRGPVPHRRRASG